MVCYSPGRSRAPQTRKFSAGADAIKNLYRPRGAIFAPYSLLSKAKKEQKIVQDPRKTGNRPSHAVDVSCIDSRGIHARLARQCRQAS